MQAAHPQPDAHEADDNERYAHVGRELPQLMAKSPDEQRDKRTDEYTQLDAGAVGRQNFAAMGQFITAILLAPQLPPALACGCSEP